MPMPEDVKVIDLMLSIPGEDSSQFYDWIKPMLMDKESHEMFKMPAQYMFKDIPDTGKQEDYIAYTLEQMDKHNIERAMIGVGKFGDANAEALRRHPDRFFGSYEANANNGVMAASEVGGFLEEIATTKKPDLTAADMDAAVRTIAGSARSMGIDTEGVE